MPSFRCIAKFLRYKPEQFPIKSILRIRPALDLVAIWATINFHALPPSLISTVSMICRIANPLIATISATFHAWTVA
jgi:hypothetical protein